MADDGNTSNTIELATELTIAWLNNPNNRANADDVPAFLQRMHTTLNGLSSDPAEEADAGDTGTEFTPAVTVRKSLASSQHIISLIDGKPYKTLRRHLSRHGLTPEQYRERYKLKSDYPMVAQDYSEQRRAMAHKIGLGARGRGARAAAPAGEGAPPQAPAQTARKRGSRKTQPKAE